jgi:hypothetical protein
VGFLVVCTRGGPGLSDALLRSGGESWERHRASVRFHTWWRGGVGRGRGLVGVGHGEAESVWGRRMACVADAHPSLCGQVRGPWPMPRGRRRARVSFRESMRRSARHASGARNGVCGYGVVPCRVVSWRRVEGEEEGGVCVSSDRPVRGGGV